MSVANQMRRSTADFVRLVWPAIGGGLIIEDLIELIPKAMRDRSGRGHAIDMEERWRYYCGVVWRTLDQIEADTAASTSRADRTMAAGEEYIPSQAEIGAWRERNPTQEEEVAYVAGFEDGQGYERSRTASADPAICPECGERPVIGGGVRLCGECWEAGL